MSRKKAEIDVKQLKAIMRFKPRVEDAAAFFEVGQRTLERFIKSEFDITFSEFRDRHMVRTRFDLARKAVDKALGGDNVMLIFCLKNMCGWKDKQPDEVDKVVVNTAQVKSDEDLDARIAELESQLKAKSGNL